MPTLLRAGPYRFSMVMADCLAPAHVHVSGGGGAAKVWLTPISVARVAGYSRHEVRIQPAIIADVAVDDERLTVRLTDGRELGTPLAASPRLATATREQRQHWTLEAMGTAIHWPDVDEDIGVWTLLGVPEDLVLEAAGFRRPAHARP